jgi:hypothetical protein
MPSDSNPNADHRTPAEKSADDLLRASDRMVAALWPGSHVTPDTMQSVLIARMDELALRGETTIVPGDHELMRAEAVQLLMLAPMHSREMDRMTNPPPAALTETDVRRITTDEVSTSIAKLPASVTKDDVDSDITGRGYVTEKQVHDIVADAMVQQGTISNTGTVANAGTAASTGTAGTGSKA